MDALNAVDAIETSVADDACETSSLEACCLLVNGLAFETDTSLGLLTTESALAIAYRETFPSQQYQVCTRSS